MGHDDSPAGSPEMSDTSSEAESDEGYLSRLQPYVRKGTQSGVIAAVVGVGTFLRALGSLLRRNWGRAVTRMTVAAAWITVAVLQRRSARERPAVPDRADVEAPMVPKTGDESGRSETTIEIGEPGEESETSEDPIDKIGTGDVEADPVEPASEELAVDEDDREIAVDDEDTTGEPEEGESEMTDDEHEDDESE